MYHLLCPILVTPTIFLFSLQVFSSFKNIDVDNWRAEGKREVNIFFFWGKDRATIAIQSRGDSDGK